MSALEQKQKEYRDMFQPQVPEPINFVTTEKDKPIEGNMEDILKEKTEERNQEMSRILGQQPLPLTNLNQSSNQPSISNPFSISPFQNNIQNNQMNPFNQNVQNMQNMQNSSVNNSQILKILEKQSIILMKLLESQVKIIDLLQKK